MAKITTLKLKEMKDNGEKISMITAYDYPTASMVEKAGIEIILVGDSLMMAVLGDDSTVACTVEQMIHHIKPVVLGAPSPMIVGDMPFGSYNESKEQAIRNATRLMKEGRCDVIKLEGGKDLAATVKAIVDAGVPVMGISALHRRPFQSLADFKIQGKGEAAKDVLEDALALQEPAHRHSSLSVSPTGGKLITEKLSIPTLA